MANIVLAHTGPMMVNTYLAWDDAGNGFMVDPGGYDERITKTIEENNISLKYIILTHGHCDHIGGVERFKERFPEAKIIAHEDEKEMLMNPELNSSVDFLGIPLQVDADLYVKDGDELQLGNEKLKIIHTPGHSRGGICVLMGDALFVGDTLFQLSVGRTDLYGGDMNTLADSIRTKLFKLKDDVVVLPGHMGETTIGYEKRYNPFVKD